MKLFGLGPLQLFRPRVIEKFGHKAIAVFFGLTLLRFGYEVIAVISVMRY